MSPNVEEEPIHDHEQVHDTLPEDQLLPQDESQSRVKEERKDEEVTPKSEPAAADIKEEVGDQSSEDLKEELRRNIDAFPPDSEDSIGPEHVADELRRLAEEFPPVAESRESPEILFVVKTDSQVTLTQMRNESVTTRSRPFANKFNYARDMCHGTSIHPASVKAVFEPGKSQKSGWPHKSTYWCIHENFCVRPWSGTSRSLICYIFLPQATSVVEEFRRRLTHICVAAGLLACSSLNGKHLIAACASVSRYNLTAEVEGAD